MGPLLIDKVFELVFSHREVDQSHKVLLGLDHWDLLPLGEGAGHIGLLGLAIVLEDGGKALPIGAHYSGDGKLCSCFHPVIFNLHLCGKMNVGLSISNLNEIFRQRFSSSING